MPWSWAGARRHSVCREYAATSFPPSELYTSAPPHDQDIVALLPILTANRDWGVLAVCGPIEDHLSSGLDSNGVWAALIGAALDHSALLESLAEQQDSLQIAYERERALANTVREIGCPVIPLLPGVLLVPLVGAIDTERARQIIEAVLAGVSGRRATDVLLDITGVPLVDTQVANSLIGTARAATLLGARVVLVGIRPEIAQSIIGLGIDLRQITTQPSLAMALNILQRQRR